MKKRLEPLAYLFAKRYGFHCVALFLLRFSQFDLGKPLLSPSFICHPKFVFCEMSGGIDGDTRLCSTGVPRIGILHSCLRLEFSLAHAEKCLEDMLDEGRRWTSSGRQYYVSVDDHVLLRRLARPESSPEDAVDVILSPRILLHVVCFFPFVMAVVPVLIEEFVFCVEAAVPCLAPNLWSLQIFEHLREALRRVFRTTSERCASRL